MYPATNDFARMLSGRIKSIGCALLMCLSGVIGAATTAPEYQLKAVFLFNFTRFVEWPQQSFAAPDSPLVIGVLGADPFGNYLDVAVNGESVNGRPLEVRRYKDANEIKNCHILFISHSEAARLPKIFADLRGRSILTVGDVEGFSREGGIIGFINSGNKIRLSIALDAATTANLMISSKLLRPADIVSADRQ